MEPFQITQNLSDAGCEEPLIDEFWRLWRGREPNAVRCAARTAPPSPAGTVPSGAKAD